MDLAPRDVLLICLERTVPLAAVLGVRGAPASTKMASVTRGVMLVGMDWSVKTHAAQIAKVLFVSRCLEYVPMDAWKDGQETSVIKVSLETNQNYDNVPIIMMNLLVICKLRLLHKMCMIYCINTNVNVFCNIQCR